MTSTTSVARLQGDIDMTTGGCDGRSGKEGRHAEPFALSHAGAHGIGEAGYAAIKAIQVRKRWWRVSTPWRPNIRCVPQAEFFSGPEFEAEQLNHWEGEEVRAYWVKVRSRTGVRLRPPAPPQPPHPTPHP